MEREMLFPEAFIIYVFTDLEKKLIMSKNVCLEVENKNI